MDHKFDIRKGVNDLLQEYASDVVQVALSESIEKTAKDSAKTLRKTSPKRYGNYRKGWKADVTHARLSTSATIYNENYRLPHLLEHGHATRNGSGRTDFKDTPAHEHVAPVEEQAGKEVIELIERKVRG